VHVIVDVAILPPKKVASIIEAEGFKPPTQFYQIGMIHDFLLNNYEVKITTSLKRTYL
jgi:hypothetical protein